MKNRTPDMANSGRIVTPQHGIEITRGRLKHTCLCCGPEAGMVTGFAIEAVSPIKEKHMNVV
jgi:hypothetical protein